MSKTEILQELPRLTPEERQEVRLRIAELDLEDWLDEGVLTDTEKALIEERFREMEANPQTSIPWEEAKARLLAAFKRCPRAWRVESAPRRTLNPCRLRPGRKL